MCKLLKTAVVEVALTMGETECGRIPVSLNPLLIAIDSPPDEESKKIRQEAGLPLFYPCEIYSTRRDDLHIPGLFSVEVQVSTNQPVLTDEMASLLCPIFVEAKAIKNLPNERSLPDKSNGVYAYIYGMLTEKSMQGVPALMSELNAKVRTPHYTPKVSAMPHDNRVKLDGKIVFFLGSIGHDNVHSVREWMMSDCLAVEVHDRDPRGDEVPGACDPPPEEEAENAESAGQEGGENAAESAESGGALGAGAKKKKKSGKVNPHGIAKFRLADLMLINNCDITLRADLFPIRCNVKQLYKELKSEGLDCATLLDRETREKVARLASSSELREFEPPYLDFGTFVQIRVIRRAPLPEWTTIQKEAEKIALENWEMLEDALPDTENLLWKAEDPRSGVVRYRFKNDASDPPAMGAWKNKLEYAEKDMFRYKKETSEAAAAAEKSTAEDAGGSAAGDDSTAPPKSPGGGSDSEADHVPNTYTTNLNPKFNDKGYIIQ